jgi:hypothetical protein
LQSVAGYTFQEILDASYPEAEHWKGVGNKGVAEIFLVPHAWKPRIDALPKNWGAFCDFDVQPFGGKLAVIIPDFLRSDLYTLQRQIGARSSVVFSWHIASALALLHDSGGAHGMLHAQSIGLDDEGRLSIRPGLLDPIQDDPDNKASAQATDCWQLAHVLEMLIGSEIDNERLRLLLGGLKQERSNIRLQPARALRQSLVAITASNPDWEGNLKSLLGDSWGMDVLPPIEHSIIPKLYPQRPRAQLPQNVDPQDYNPWSSPFVSTKSERLEAPKRISIPSGIKTELKIRLPTPSQNRPMFEEEVELLEQESQTTAQVRLPFVSIVPDAASVDIEQIQQVSVQANQEPAILDDVLVEEDPIDLANVDDSVPDSEPVPEPVQRLSKQDFGGISVVSTPNSSASVSQESESFEEASAHDSEHIEPKEDQPHTPSLKEGLASAAKPVVAEQEDAFAGLSPQDEIEKTDKIVPPSVHETKRTAPAEPVGKNRVLHLQNPTFRREDKTQTFLLKIPEIEEGFVDFIDEDALLSEDETNDVSEEKTAIAVETMIERREIDEVEEVLLHKPEIQNKIPEIVIPAAVRPEIVVPEFFDDSEEPADDFDSFESEDELASVSVYEDSVADDVHHAQHAEADPLGSEEDFLASIFNDRDIKVLEAASANNLSAILPQDGAFETEGEELGETEEFIPSASHSEGYSERVAGFEESIEDSVLDHSNSEEYSFSNERIDVVESLTAAFQVDKEAQNLAAQNSQNQSAQSFVKDSPRWMSAKGINADPMREDELGSGKWGNAQSNLDQDILKEVMSTTPVRELDLDDDGNAWALLLVGLAGLVLFLLILYGVVSGL